MKEIAISKQSITIIVILILLAAGGWYALQSFSASPIMPTPTPNVDDSQAAAAIIAGIEAFFNVDYQQGQEAWLDQFCAVTSESGCQFAKLGAASLWKKYQDAKTVTSASVQPDQKVKHTADEQVWRVRIQLSAPLPGSEKTTDTAYALAVRTNAGWKFDRFLMPEEIRAIEKSATPTAPAEGVQK
jgi:predicted negative regulator of RcsB-dependent stress response